jgi:hypothetical protein
MHSYREHFDRFTQSGLSRKLIKDEFLTPYEHVELFKSNDTYCVLKPTYLEHISYPYEWSFSQLKDAALLTLKIAKISLDFGMVLKDASAYNVQFVDGKAQFIDTLSFENYKQNAPWIAYRQFCQHFLAPLYIMKYKDISLNSMLKIHLDGIPLDLACKILGTRKLMPKVFFHLFLQSRLVNNKIILKEKNINYHFDRKDHLKIIENLTDIVDNLTIKISNSKWGDYYESKILNNSYLFHKQKIIEKYLSTGEQKTVYDFGANTGLFSRIASRYSKQVISTDNDPECIELSYRKSKENNEKNILPLIVDLANPNPAIGWDNMERNSFFERMKNDTIMAVALIHHLVISNNLPLPKIAAFFSKYCKKLIIEYIPVNDPKVKELLQNRENIYQTCTQSYFEQCFKKYFQIIQSDTVDGSNRKLYLMHRNNEKLN